MRSSTLRAIGLGALLASCGGDDGARTRARDCTAPGEEAATAGCLEPTFAPEHYVEQSLLYFDTLASATNPFVAPRYSDLVVRWEWPPWLLLTGYGRESLLITDLLLKLYPTAYFERDCRYFPVQPFGRCRVVFDYSGFPCPIYEEFAFNDQGEITFIEAWTDLPGLLPTGDPSDAWAEGPGVRRLATKVPGLGNATGLIDLDAPWMEAAASADPEVADLLARLRAPYRSWLSEALRDAGGDFLVDGCTPAALE